MLKKEPHRLKPLSLGLQILSHAGLQVKMCCSSVSWDLVIDKVTTQSTILVMPSVVILLEEF